tara:strand:- start:3203 stop:3514 length:312 start_codon:yes stop_codon:yes gene_type:complete
MVLTNSSKQLKDLTVSEFLEILEKSNERLSETNQNRNDLLNSNQAAKLLGYKKSTIYSKVSRGEVPVYSSGRPLVFSKKDLLEWMENGRPNISEKKANSFLNK